MIYLYNYFLTKKNISEKDFENALNISKIIPSTKISLLTQYKDKIDNFIKENNIDILKFNKHKNRSSNILKNLSSSYDNILIKEKNIYSFFNILISYKLLIEKNNINIDSFKNINTFYNKPFIINYDKNASFYNPFQYNFTNNFSNIKDYLKLNKNSNKNTIINKLSKSIDILTQGNIINVTLPSIGIIRNNFSKSDTSYISFMEKIVKMKDNHSNISDYIPLKFLDLGTTISNLLFETNDINIKSKKDIFINIINNFSVNLNEILINDKKINREFIIPYKIDTLKKNEVIPYTDIDIERIKNEKDLIEKNNLIVEYVLKNIIETKNNIKVLDNKNFKNVMACYIFYLINLTYSISKLYLDKIDNFLIDIISSEDKRHGKLNIKRAFEFTSLLKKSLYQFKLLLFNNFYNLFIPSKISSGNYGMKINEFGCYVPESLLLIPHINLLENYPFYGNINTIEINIDKLENFILNSSNIYDLYDTNIKLEIGGFFEDYFITKKSINVLENYYKNLLKNNNFNLFIINLLINNFKNKNIPIELLDDIKYSGSEIRNNKIIFETKILLNYDINLDKAYEYALNTIQLRNKIKNSLNKKINVTNLLNNEIIYICTYNIYYLKSLGIINIVNNINLDMNFKNLLLEKMMERKKEYENKLSRNL